MASLLFVPSTQPQPIYVHHLTGHCKIGTLASLRCSVLMGVVVVIKCYSALGTILNSLFILAHAVLTITHAVGFMIIPFVWMRKLKPKITQLVRRTGPSQYNF